MTRWVCGILAFILILTCCVNVFRKINGVDDPMYFQEIVIYIGNQKNIENTVTDIINNVEEILQVFPDVIGVYQTITQEMDEKQKNGKWYEQIGATVMNLLVGMARDFTLAVEGIVVGVTIVLYSLPMLMSILREFVYIARIVAYVCFDIPLNAGY